MTKSNQQEIKALLIRGEKIPQKYTITEMAFNRFRTTPLLVLSACETARGKIGRGDEIIGLIRGLTLAGATAIVATKWQLSDAVAPHFMKALYEFLLEGKQVVTALYHARKKMVRMGFTKPFDWGIYELYGNPFKIIVQKITNKAIQPKN
ncbi:MAG: CHAT domain-containing protein [Candidatus Heimdallarchaeota archaeon]|nr:CHAT domain-containing protein [Candidatus Heimdallarchaeota archaeon]